MARTRPGVTMTPADRRISELIAKWLASIELHLKYVELSDAAYARAQPWPQHDRPTRWVLEVARQKILELKQHCEARQAMGDSKFSEALELMAFLANLVGIQNIQRFIPLADPSRDGTGGTTMLEQPTTIIKPAARPQAPPEEPTREMPRIKPSPKPAQPPPPKASAQPKVQSPSRAAKSTPAGKSDGAQKPLSDDMKSKITADAVRLLKWGKPWHELAELIARIAERPPAAEIRKFLRAHKADIEAKAAMEPKRK